MSFAKPPHVQSEKRNPMEQREDHAKSTGSTIGKHTIQVKALSKTKLEKEMNKGVADSGLLHKEKDEIYNRKKESMIPISEAICSDKIEGVQESDDMKEEYVTIPSTFVFETRRDGVKYEWEDEDDPELVRIAEYAEWAKKVGNM